MTTFYMDLEGGNDANDGTTFANRWKTFSSGPTNARITAGDTIRIMASRDMVNLGNATWTDNSATVTLAAAKTLHIWKGDAAFTGVSTDVTGNTTTSTLKIGATRPTAALAAGFTTGKIAYFTLPSTVDASSYEQVSFWILSSVTSTVTSEWLQLKLCSDSIGDTAVHTATVACRANCWAAITVDFAGAMSSGINSIALYATSDPGTPTISVQNILACKAASASDCLTLETVISRNTATDVDWYPILSIDDTALLLGGDYGVSLSTTTNKYRGIGGTETLYGRMPVPHYTIIQPQDSGSYASGQITYSGGWNRTDMSTKTGETWITFRDYYNDWGFNASNGAHGWTFEDISLGRQTANGMVYAQFYTNPAAPCIINNMNIFGTLGNACNMNAEYALTQFSFNSVCGFNSPMTLSSNCLGSFLKVNGISQSHGSTEAFAVYSLTDLFITVGTMRNLYRGFMLWYSDHRAPIIIKSGKVYGTRNSFFIGNNYNEKFVFIGPEGDSPPTFSTYDSCGANGLVVAQKYNGDANDHRFYSRFWSGKTDTAVRHTASGFSWSLLPASATYCTKSKPAKIALCKIACVASSLVTVKCWMRRSNTGISAGLYLPPFQLDGISATEVLMTAAADTWEEVTLTFTPTEAGVVQLWGIAYGGSTYTAWFDDLTITQ